MHSAYVDICLSIIAVLLTSARLPAARQDSELYLESSNFHRLLIFVEDRRVDQPTGEESRLLVENIKDGFRDASRLLQTLTAGVGRPLRIGSASILVSARLGRQLSAAGMTVGQAQWQRRNRADFVVSHDVDASTEGCVAMEIGCGKPGKKVVMLDSSFTNDTRRIVDRKIALFFSQYRWGLLSEQPIGSPIETGPDGELRVSACSAELRVHLADENGRSTCEFDLNSRQTSQGCAPRLSDSQPDGPLASFMFAPFHRDVSRFCDSQSRDPRLQHNRLVDSLMNRQCDGLSASEVIRLHRDYWGTPAGTQPAPGDVVFDVVAEKSHRRVVVVMDVSGSMDGHRISMMKNAVTHFLMDVIEDGSECGLISFTDSHKVLSTFRKIQSRQDRESLAYLVSKLNANGGTCIAGAVSTAASLLGFDMSRKHSVLDPATGQIILLSDGEEGCKNLTRVIDMLANSSLEVVSIRYGDTADKQIDKLAEVTGGRKFFGGAAQFDSSGLRLALGGTVSELEESKRSLTLTYEKIEGGPFFRRIFYVDKSVKRDLVFQVSAPLTPSRVTQLQLVLTSPSGRQFGYQNASSIYESNDNLGTITIRVPDTAVEVGTWTLVNVTNYGIAFTSGDGALISVTARVADNSSEAPVILTAEVSPSNVTNLSVDTKIMVYARLLKGHTPVTNGKLYATVRSDRSIAANFALMDNGAGADLKANDGTYSAYLPVAHLDEARDYPVSVMSLYPVSRVSSAGKVSVHQISPLFNRQLISPVKVIDFRVIVSLMDRAAILFWTSIEDPTRPNKSVNYVIKYSSSRLQLVVNSSKCQNLTTVPGDRAAPGSTMRLNVFHLLAEKGAVFLTIFGISSSQVMGSQSNLVGIDVTPPSAGELKQLQDLGLKPIKFDPGLLGATRADFSALVAGVCAAVAAVSSLITLSLVLQRRILSGSSAAADASGAAAAPTPELTICHSTLTHSVPKSSEVNQENGEFTNDVYEAVAFVSG